MAVTAVLVGATLLSGALAADQANKAAKQERQLASRNSQAVLEAQTANEVRSRRFNQQTQGRFAERVAASGFTSRGTPLERFGDLVAEQEENVLIDRFNARTQAQDIKFRGEVRSDRLKAEGVSSLLGATSGSARTLLTTT